jgi:O-antigen/teichoic acid export membrane protein
LNALLLRKWVAISQALDAWLRLVIATAFVLSWGDASYLPLLGFCLANLIVAVAQTRFLASIKTTRGMQSAEFNIEDKERSYRELKRYANPFISFAALGIVSLYADRWILQTMFGEHSVGIYAALYQIANAPLIVLFGVLNQYLMPVVFGKRKESRPQEGIIRDTLYTAIAVTTLLTVTSYAYGQHIVLSLSSDEFAKHHDALWILVLALGISNVAQTLSVKGYVLNRPGVYVWPRFIHAAGTLLFGIPLAAILQIDGLCYALLVSSTLYLALVALVNKRLAGSQNAI